MPELLKLKERKSMVSGLEFLLSYLFPGRVDPWLRETGKYHSLAPVECSASRLKVGEGG